MLCVCVLNVLTNRCHADTEIIPDVVYGHKDGMALTYDLCLPEAEKRNGAGVLFMVSGAWVSRWVDPKTMLSPLNPMSRPFRLMIDEGYAIYFVRHGSAPRYKVPDAVADVQRAVGHIRQNAEVHGIDPDRLGATGLSAGGHLSLVLGTMGKDGRDGATLRKPPIAAVVAWFPPTDLEPYLDRADEFAALDFDEREARAISPRYHVDACDAPVLLLHGDKDRLVPLIHSEAMAEALESKGVPVELVVFPNQAHGFNDGEGARAAQLMIEFFDTHLAPSENSDGES